MSRLIDADKLIEDLKSSHFYIAGLRSQKSILGHIMTQYAKFINKTIEEQPTAFDVDKVVGQLDEKSQLIRPVGWLKHYEVIITKEVLEIVKEGGISDNR